MFLWRQGSDVVPYLGPQVSAEDSPLAPTSTGTEFVAMTTGSGRLRESFATESTLVCSQTAQVRVKPKPESRASPRLK